MIDNIYRFKSVINIYTIKHILLTEKYEPTT